MKPDRTDFLTWAAVLLSATALAVLLAVRPDVETPGRRAPSGAAAENDPELEALRRVLGHFPAVPGDEEKLGLLLASEPGNSRARFSRGELAWRAGDLAAAAADFRRAVEQNRGYVDRSSPLDRGELMRQFADQAQPVYLREKELRPDDAGVKRTIKDIYFIRRAMAGGCD
jgi:hypothetical protein